MKAPWKASSADQRREGARQGRGPPDLQDRQVVVVAGCYVTQGRISARATPASSATARWSGKARSRGLKRFKDDVKEVAEGFECGISLDGFSDIKEKDIIESFEIEEVAGIL